MIDTVVTETNRYAEQTSTRTPHRRLSRTRIWEDVTKVDIWIFVGVLILQGIIHKPQQRWYWSTNRLLETPIFRRVMSVYRFSLSMKFLHFANIDNFDPNSYPVPKLKKIWEIYQALLANFRQVYTPSRVISVDESLMAYKGRLSWIQYILSKRARFELKFILSANPTQDIYMEFCSVHRQRNCIQGQICRIRNFHDSCTESG